MSDREDQLFEELVSAGMPVGVRSGAFARRYESFQDWLRVQGVTKVVPSDELLALYLFAQHDRWAYGTAFNIASAIRWVSRDRGLGDPWGPLTRKYLSTLRAEKGVVVRQGTEALDFDDVARMVSAYRESGINDRMRLRQALIILGGAIAEARSQTSTPLGNPLSDVAHLPLSAVTEEPGRIRFTDPVSGATGVVEASADPRGFDIVRDFLARVRGQQTCIGFATGSAKAVIFNELQRFCQVSGHQWEVTIASCRGSERDRILDAQDRHRSRAITGIAYFLIGLVTTRRSAELSRLRLSDIHLTDEGEFVFSVGEEEKSSQAAVRQGGAPRSRNYVIGHIRDGASTDCSPICPACALFELIALRRRSGALDSDLLFVTPRGKPCGPDYGNLLIRSMCEAAGVDPTRVYGSRVMRVTGATLASRQGFTDVDIADLMMCSLTNVRRYNRHNPYPGGDPLPLDDPNE